MIILIFPHLGFWLMNIVLKKIHTSIYEAYQLSWRHSIMAYKLGTK
jgi:hypothetical protein